MGNEQKIEYLYSNNNLTGLYRHVIIRETENYYFIDHDKISKKRMATGSKFNVIRYQLPTIELDRQFDRQRRAAKASHMLNELARGANCGWLSDNIDVIKNLYDGWKDKA